MVTMRRNKTKDDADIDDARDVIPDGGSVRVPLLLTDHQPGFVSVNGAAVRDAQRMARDARDAYVQRLTSAWRTPLARDAGEPDAAEALLKRHLRSEPTEPDEDDAQARRDRQWAEYCDRISNAWRTNPQAATTVERQGEQWRGGR
jgi:hypothetical protein